MRSRAIVFTVSHIRRVKPPANSRMSISLRPIDARTPTLTRSTACAAWLSSTSRRTCAIDLCQHAPGSFYSPDHHAAFGGQVKVHLVYLFQALVHVAQLPPRLVRKAGKVAADGSEGFLAGFFRRNALSPRPFDPLLPSFHRSIRDVELAYVG